MRTFNNNKVSTFIHITICCLIVFLTMFLFMGNIIAATEVTIKGSVVNVRSGPGLNYSVLTTVRQNSKYAVIKVSNGWYNIVLNGNKNGWVNGSVITVSKPSTNQQNNNQTNANKKVMVNGSIVNVRSGPGVTYKVIASLKKGTILTYVKSTSNWYNVILANKTSGWVAGSYVQIIKSDNNQTAPSSSSDSGTKVVTKNKVSVTVDKANIRKDPSLTASIIGNGSKGETFPLINTKNGWHNILLKNNQRGWISSEVTKVIGDSGVLTGDNIITADFIQVVMPKTKGIMPYTVKTLQNPYRLIVTVNNVHPDSTSLSDIDLSNNPLVSKIEVAVDPVKRSLVTYTYYLSQPIHYNVYSTPGDNIGSDKIARDTDTYDKKVTIKISPLTLIGKKIVIDAGHGGTYPDPRADSGAVARDSSGKLIYKEKDFNLSVALLLAKKLREQGAEVILTRSTDIYLSLYERTRIANQAEADIFISIHANSGSSASIGAESIKNTETNAGKPFLKSQATMRNMLANAVQTNLIKSTGAKNRGYYEDVRGLAVLRTSRMPSILVEVGFLSNKSELAKLMSPTYQGKAADGIAAGVNSFFTTAN